MGRISAYCIGCMIKAQEERIRHLKDEKAKADYMKELCRLIVEAEDEMSVPVLVTQNDKLIKEYFGIEKTYENEKKEYNEFVLGYEEEIWNNIVKSPDPLLEALKYARVGNYIDFGAVKNVEQNQLKLLLDRVKTDHVDEQEYENLCCDLEQGSSLVYLTDNCGEIVLDKLFIKMIQQKYPDLHITVVVRGSDVLNDASYGDAEAVGLTKLVHVVDNGCDVAGTPLAYIGNEARTLIENADVVIAKGQGNFETMNGCGLNVYYMFLCKCTWFEMRFQMKQFEGVLINDRNLKAE